MERLGLFNLSIAGLPDTFCTFYTSASSVYHLGTCKASFSLLQLVHYQVSFATFEI